MHSWTNSRLCCVAFPTPPVPHTLLLPIRAKGLAVDIVPSSFSLSLSLSSQRVAFARSFDLHTDCDPSHIPQRTNLLTSEATIDWLSSKSPMRTPMFSEQEQTELAHWSYTCTDHSIVSEYLGPTWDWLLYNCVPEWVAPNVLSLAGFLCMTTTFALWMTGLMHPVLVAVLIMLYQTLDALDGKQARRIRNCTALGEIMDHGCDAVCMVWLCAMLAQLLGITDPEAVWCAVYLGQLAFVTEHLRVLQAPGLPVEFPKWTGPGEALVVIQALFLLEGLCSLPSLLTSMLPGFTTIVGWGLMGAYILAFMGMGLQLESLSRTRHRHTAGIVMLCYCIGCAHGLFWPVQSQWGAIAQGVALAVLAAEIILCKMATRTAHPVVLVTVLLSLVAVPGTSICFSLFHLGWILYSLAQSTGRPFFHVYTVYTPRMPEDTSTISSSERECLQEGVDWDDSPLTCLSCKFVGGSKNFAANGRCMDCDRNESTDDQ
jgi:phosphatidylglycerophosphate synthase